MGGQFNISATRTLVGRVSCCGRRILTDAYDSLGERNYISSQQARRPRKASITPVKLQQSRSTFDVEFFHQYHNFLLNGILENERLYSS